MHQLWNAIEGGALFGAGAGLLLVGIGRIAGVGGITLGVLRPSPRDLAWRIFFLLGLLGGGMASGVLFPEAIAWHNEPSASRLVVAGLCIGVGARIANGCTSGHGICGVARLSPRSIVAVATFTIAGALVQWMGTHWKGPLS